MSYYFIVKCKFQGFRDYFAGFTFILLRYLYIIVKRKAEC